MTDQNIPWVEKYRPKKIDDIAHQEEVKAMLRSVIETGSMPHLLFYGPPGTGKTSAVHALAKELFGEEAKNRVLELNASDERGIGVVRDRIKNWTRTVVSNKVDPHTGRRLPRWKIVILDEADMMTTDAQSALRRIIEDTSKQTRFVIICNYLAKIIDPLSSRCAKFRFEPISDEAQVKRLQNVTAAEKLDVPDDALNTILDICGGDLRIGMTLLQTSSNIFQGKVTPEVVMNVAGVCPPAVVTELLRECASAKSVDVVEAKVSDIVADGWDTDQIIKLLNTQVIFEKQLTCVQKANITLRLAEAQHNLVEGSNEYITLLWVCTHIQQVIQKPSQK